MQKLIPMTKATGLGPMPKMLEEYAGGTVLNRVFQQENVPLEILDNRETWMPLGSMVGLFEKAGHEAGNRTFGLNVGQAMTHDSYGMWLVYCASAPTLGEALRRSAITARFQQSGSRLLAVHNGPYTIWRYFVPGVFESPMQHADHILGPMMKFVRTFLGGRWQPEWVELNYRRDAEAHLLERELKSPVRFGCRNIGVAIRTDQMSATSLAFRHGGAAANLTMLDVHASEVKTEFAEPVQALFSIVVLRLLDGQSDVEGAARMAGIGVQTLQRRLRREGLTYRNIVESAKLSKARSLLRESELKITDIAFGLGYSDHANFTRAFTRWTKCSPSEYRRAAAG